MVTNLNLTDIECCSKALRRSVLEKLTIQEDRFGVEVELVAKLSSMRIPHEQLTTAPGATRSLRIYEVAVSYAGRTYADGKKITLEGRGAGPRRIFRYGIMGR